MGAAVMRLWLKFRKAGLPAVMGAMMAAGSASGAHPCASCHPQKVAGYAATQMAHSLGVPGRELAGKFFHAPSKTQFTIQMSHGRMIQRMDRNGVTSEYPVAY